MSEKITGRIEREPQPIDGIKPERQPSKETSVENQRPVPNIEKLRSKIETEAKTAKEVSVGEKEKPVSDQPTHINRDMKLSAYASSLKTIRDKLNGPERMASKVVHQPMIEQISNVTAQTIARPSGILGGAICALLGSLGLLLFAKHFGISYNYLVIFLFYAGGFVIGLVLEMLGRLIRPRGRQL